LNAASPKAVR